MDEEAERYTEMMSSYLTQASDQLLAKTRDIILRHKEEVLAHMQSHFDTFKKKDEDVGHEWPDRVEMTMDESRPDLTHGQVAALPKIRIAMKTSKGFTVDGWILLRTAP